MKKIVSVVGPTASGKTSLAIKIAKEFAGEVISADSRQVYRGLDIGTAKVTEEEMNGIPHHLLDVADMDQVYTAADFKRDGEKVLENIWEREKLPIIAGGTFFYVDALLGKIHLHDVPPNEALRAALETLTTEELFAKLQETDSDRAETIDPENRRRLIRSLEIADALGHVPTNKSESLYDVLTIGIEVEKDTLRQRLEKRAQEWCDGSLQSEVEGLLESGVSEDRLREIGFEYMTMLSHIKGEITGEDLSQRFVEKNWQYAKRQMTWLKRDNSIQWFQKDDSVILTTIQAFLNTKS